MQMDPGRWTWNDGDLMRVGMGLGAVELLFLAVTSLVAVPMILLISCYLHCLLLNTTC